MIIPNKFELDYYFQAYHDKQIIKVNIMKDFPDKYVILLFYPYDFTTVCPTEINKLSDRKDEFQDTVILVISCDSIFSHMNFEKLDRENKGVSGCQLIMVSDYERILGNYLNVCEKIRNHQGELVDSNHLRCTFIFDKSLSLIHFNYYKKEMGRNSDELLRVIEMNQKIERDGEMCSCDWNKK